MLTFQPETHVEFYLRMAWLNAVFRARAELPASVPRCCPAAAEDYYSCIEAIALGEKDMLQQTEVRRAYRGFRVGGPPFLMSTTSVRCPVAGHRGAGP
jgi:hypothetical protein